MSQKSIQTRIVEFVALHDKIKSGFADLGVHLRRMRDEKLWDVKYASFKDYCEDTVGSYLKGYRLIEASKVAKEIPEVTTQAAALAVSKIPPRQQKQIVGQVVESGQQVNAKTIEQAAKNFEPIKDNSGMDVPKELIPFWNRNEEIQSMLGNLRRIRGLLEKAQGKPAIMVGDAIMEAAIPSDPLFRKMDLQACISRLKMIESELKGTKSDYVCPDCNGLLIESCDLCARRGSISEFFWKMIPEEKRNLRNK
jgi:predicted RNA-binding Zn-ribbon protein involved in translation (DUF1610 family)